MGSLEGAVLEVLWDSDDPLKPGDVLDRLEIKPAVSYPTVATILRRLCKKQLITREKRGKAYVYTPSQSREQQVARAMADAFAAASAPSVALGHFVSHLSADETSALHRALGRRR